MTKQTITRKRTLQEVTRTTEETDVEQSAAMMETQSENKMRQIDRGCVSDEEIESF